MITILLSGLVLSSLFFIDTLARYPYPVISPNSERIKEGDSIDLIGTEKEINITKWEWNWGFDKVDTNCPDASLSSNEKDNTIHQSSATFTSVVGSAGCDYYVGLKVTDAIHDPIPADNALVSVLPAAKPTILKLDTIQDVDAGQTITVTGSLVIDDGTGKGVSQKEITFRGSGAQNLQRADTDADGLFTVVSNAPTAKGTWKVQAQFDGDPDFKGSVSKVAKYKTVTPATQAIATALHLENIEDVDAGQTITVTGSLVIDDGTGKGVSQKEITFRGSGAQNLQRADTDADGLFTVVANAPTAKGTWKVQAQFDGDPDFKGSVSKTVRYKTSGSSINPVPHPNPSTNPPPNQDPPPTYVPTLTPEVWILIIIAIMGTLSVASISHFKSKKHPPVRISVEVRGGVQPQ